ncbi:MAG: type II secretion system protein GspE, partial [Rhodospirillales bacterium]|nr:type II secretion system protein GspE [Rhodospirillales bacterium]
NQTGYRGRISILEIMEISDPIRQMILRHAEANEIQRTAVENGMKVMFDDGVNKALQGVTTIEEILRVTREG